MDKISDAPKNDEKPKLPSPVLVSANERLFKLFPLIQVFFAILTCVVPIITIVIGVLSHNALWIIATVIGICLLFIILGIIAKFLSRDKSIIEDENLSHILKLIYYSLFSAVLASLSTIILLIIAGVSIPYLSRLTPTTSPVTEVPPTSYPTDTLPPKITDTHTSIPESAQKTPIPRPNTVLIQKDTYTIGSEALGPKADVAPPHPFELDAYLIGKFEVTNGEYKLCVDASKCDPPRKYSSLLPSRSQYFVNPLFKDYPVIYVNYEQALNYCDWKDGTLPTEEQWEAAGRRGPGDESRTYPWGEAITQLGWANLLYVDGNYTDTSQVGTFYHDKTPDGVYDLVGNVMEWTSSWYKFYPGNSNRTDYAGIYRVVKGANYRIMYAYEITRLYFRTYKSPDSSSPTIGFRCVWAP